VQKKSSDLKKAEQSEITKSPFDLFEALYLILSEAKPHKLEIECLAEFVKDVENFREWDGDYMRAANHALVEWDI
jgi:hypothetical protein